VEGQNPGAEAALKIHATLFAGVLESAGKFRDDPRTTAAQDGSELCAGHEIAGRLDKNAEPVKDIVREKSPARQIRLLADYHANFMAIKPFKEIPNSNFVNRAVAAVILEGQLQHCFRSELIKREADAKEHREALHWRNEHCNSARLEKVIREMAGPRAKVLSFDRSSSGPEIERDR